MNMTTASRTAATAWALALAAILTPSTRALAAPASTAAATATAPSPDAERIAFLIAQDQRHSADIARLEADLTRPKSKEEAFAACMQAARGQTNPMVAESIGEHCDKLLK